jgi:hypothetical protein
VEGPCLIACPIRESVPYVAGWGEDGALEAVSEFAETIDTIARRIEDAVLAPG